MKTWVVGALVGACVGVAIYLALSQKPAPPAESRNDAPPASPDAPVPPTPPVVLTEVVEVTDIDHLLDPPSRPETGVPFDDTSATMPVSAPTRPTHIPPAADGAEPAPMPRAIPDRFANGDSYHF